MEPRLSLLTLGVPDVERSTRFYDEVLGLPRLASPPTISFFELGKTWLALYRRDLLTADVGVSHVDDSHERTGFPDFTLAHNVGGESEVDELLHQISERVGAIVKPAQHADWGGYPGYFADTDGYLWEVAWNPHFPHV